MQIQIFNSNQNDLLPLVKQFRKEFYLVGGTAIALHLGHRRSIDFDLFKYNALKPKNIISTISECQYPYVVSRRVTEQLNVTIHDVKLTFFQYPFKIQATEKLDDILRLPPLLDLAAMKAYALGRRSKWKDYVDLYYILNGNFSFKQVSERSTDIFGQLFSEKLFRAKLCFFDDIDFSEPIEFLGDAVPENIIKDFLTETAIDFL
jgi:hypothetical protein